MDLLGKKITADWIDIRDKMSAPTRMKSYLKLEEDRLSTAAANLHRCTLDGTVEFKRRSLNGIFSFLSRLTHQTPSQVEILEREAELRFLIYMNCLETQFATGVFRPGKEETSNNAAESEPQVKRISLDQVVHDVTARLNNDPGLAKDPRVKNILMEVQLYKKEYDQFKALSPKIPDERASSFLSNFKQRIGSIVDTIYGHYEELLAQERSESDREVRLVEDDLFLIPGLNRLLATQAQEFCILRSTINYALQEGYQIRPLLLQLTNKHDPVLALVEEEGKLLDTVKRQSSGHETAVKLARNVALALEGSVRKG